MQNDEIEKTKELITELEELVALAPEDESLAAMLAELYGRLEEQTSSAATDNDYPMGTQCAIAFPLNQHYYLLSAMVIERRAKETMVLILTPVTSETVPCTAFLSKPPGCTSPCQNGRSHGYTVSNDMILPLEAMDMDNADSYVVNKRVWCDGGVKGAVWRMARIMDVLDNGQQWRLSWIMPSSGQKQFTAGIDSIVPVKCLDDDTEENEQDNREEEEEEEQEEEEDDIPVVIPKGWRGWQQYTTGFGAKMMAKMGYIEGQGLGRHGQGRVEPVEARPYQRKGAVRDSASDQRPGLGSLHTAKRKKVKQEPPEERQTIFDFMDSLINTKVEERTIPSSSSSLSKKIKPSQKTSSTMFAGQMDVKAANRTLAKLQTEIASVSNQLAKAIEAIQRNRGTATENQFRSKAKAVAKKLEDLKLEASTLQNSIKQAKDREKMISF